MRPPAERHFLALKARERSHARARQSCTRQLRTTGVRDSAVESKFPARQNVALVACVPTTVWCMRKAHRIRWGDSELGVNRAERPWDA